MSAGPACANSEGDPAMLFGGFGSMGSKASVQAQSLLRCLEIWLWCLKRDVSGKIIKTKLNGDPFVHKQTPVANLK